MGGGIVLLTLALAPAPDESGPATSPPPLTLEMRRDADADREDGGVYGPKPPPELTGHHAADDVQVTIAPDGTAKAHVPRPIRGTAGVCLLGLCLSTRGVRRQPNTKRGMKFATAPVPFSLAFAFGYAPASKNAAVALLAESSDARIQQTIAWQQRALADARRDLGRRLADIVHDPELSADDKRRIVFELWDDAVTTAHGARDDAMARQRADAAAKVAAAIERFVAQSMPRGSTLGYSPRQLARLNARRSVRFSPYGGGADRDDDDDAS